MINHPLLLNLETDVFFCSHHLEELTTVHRFSFPNITHDMIMVLLNTPDFRESCGGSKTTSIDFDKVPSELRKISPLCCHLGDRLLLDSYIKSTPANPLPN